MRNISSTLLVPIIIYIVIGIYFTISIHEVVIRILPEPDVIEFVEYSDSFDSWKMPREIKSAPLLPILLSIFSPLVTAEYPKIWLSSFINIIAGVFSIIFLWHIAKHHLSLLSATMITLIYMSNARNYTIFHQSGTQPLLSSLALLTYLVYPSHRGIAYTLSVISFLTRYDGISVFVALCGYELYIYSSKHSNTSYFKNILLSLKQMLNQEVLISGGVILGWSIYVLLHNISNGQPHGNDYFRELITHTTHGDSHRMIVESIRSIIESQWLYHITFLDTILSILLVFLVVTACFVILTKKSKLLILVVYLFSYTAIHLLFPFFPDKYFLPIAGVILVLSAYSLEFFVKNRMLRIVRYCVFILTPLLLLANMLSFTQHIDDDKYNLAEKKYLADWLNQQHFPNTTYVIAFAPKPTDFFTKNERVKFVYINQEESATCQSLGCIIRHRNLSGNILIAKDTASNQRDSFAIHELKASLFQSPQDEPCLLHIHSIDQNHRWVDIYRYHTHCY